MQTTKSKFKEWLSIMGQNKLKLLGAIFLLIAAVAIYAISGIYVSDQTWSSVPDLILNHIGPYNLTFIFTYLFMAVIILFIFYPLLYHPKRFPSTLGMLSLLVITRSLFMLFTHFGAPTDAIKISAPGILSFLSFSNDLFFSGHTAIPFLGFLIFRKYNKKLGYFMLASSIILAITVLLMHVHYSIDVFAAYFIAYGTYKIGKLIFDA
jgi:hypothetical protein